MKELSCKLLVIGAGPGGYVCAIRAGQLGVDTIIVEAARPGGTCLTVGCIPSKAMIHAADEYARLAAAAAGGSPFGLSAEKPALDLAMAVAWKDGIVGKLTTGVAGLLKRAGVKTVVGWARFRDGKTVEVETETGVQVIRAEAVVIATGSEPVELPSLAFGDKVISSTGALDLTDLPEKLVVVGAGYIGLELGIAFRKLGAEVAIVEMADRLLPLLPGGDKGALVAGMNALAARVTLAEVVPLGDFLRGLRARGLRIGLVTNDAEAPARAHLAAARVADLFDFVAGCDSGHGAKPAPGQLLAFLRATGIAPARAVMVGDSLHDLHAGRAAGMRVLGVLTGIAGAADLAPHADAVLPDIGGLPAWLEGIAG